MSSSTDAQYGGDVAALMNTLGQQARQAATHMAAASAAQKNAALHALADLLAEQGEFLQAANAQDIARAEAAGLSAPMVDRLRLTDKVIDTLQEGCLQLAAMPDVIGTVTGLQERPSGIRVGQMRVPIGVFGMIFESRPNVTIEAASLSIKSGKLAFCAVAAKRLNPTRRWRPWCSRHWKPLACPPTPCKWCR